MLKFFARLLGIGQPKEIIQEVRAPDGELYVTIRFTGIRRVYVTHPTDTRAWVFDVKALDAMIPALEAINHHYKVITLMGEKNDH